MTHFSFVGDLFCWEVGASDQDQAHCCGCLVCCRSVDWVGAYDEGVISDCMCDGLRDRLRLSMLPFITIISPYSHITSTLSSF
jgi:hypothetical protein